MTDLPLNNYPLRIIRTKSLLMIYKPCLLRLGVTITVAFVLLSCSGTSSEPISETKYALGTFITVRIYDRVSASVFAPVFDRVQEIERKMSTNEANYAETDLLRVNRAAGVEPVPVSAETALVIERALHYAALSHGAFDPSIGPLVRLWDIGGDNERVPTAAEIDVVRAMIDYRLVQLLPQQQIFLPTAGMALDVGGIAKGYAADEARRVLAERGVKHALLDFGGNIIAMGSRPGGSPWRIGIQHPEQVRDSYLGIVQVIDETVVTSGPYERYFLAEGVRYHHIFDAATGYPANQGLVSTTIITSNSTTADALSTAVYVLGLARGAALIDSLPGVEAILVNESREVFVSPGLRDRFVLTARDHTLLDWP